MYMRSLIMIEGKPSRDLVAIYVTRITKNKTCIDPKQLIGRYTIHCEPYIILQLNPPDDRLKERTLKLFRI